MIFKYELVATGYINVISQLKEKVHNGSLKLKNYEREQFQRNTSVPFWIVPSSHKHNVRWLPRLKQELTNVEKQDDIKITVKSIQKCVSDMSNWKSPGPDTVPGWCYKRMKTLHDRLKGGITNNYRPLSCLPIMCKC